MRYDKLLNLGKILCRGVHYARLKLMREITYFQFYFTFYLFYNLHLLLPSFYFSYEVIEY